uniref:Tail fiber protein n=1 Tax=Pseudomonas phage Arace01 TaxID=3138526 RepID=A0AAU6VZW3_9VIRU
MGFRPTFDIQHEKAEDPMVDKRIGNAYKTVKYVADHMEELIKAASGGGGGNTGGGGGGLPAGYAKVIVEGTTGQFGGANTIVPFPAGVNVGNIVESNVQIRTPTGLLMSENANLFTAYVVGTLGGQPINGLYLLLATTNDALMLINSTIIWSITYKAS